ncbi:Receptor-like kinase TMK4-like protein [Drosera capensis]
MSPKTPRFILLIITFFSISISSAADDDSAAMSALLAAISPPPSGWSTSTSYCKWPGISCDSSTGRVATISLASKSLAGTLPSTALSSLPSLSTLSLQNNSFTGPIPSLANLTALQQVYLDSNSFTSVTPGAFSGLTGLQVLSLSGNGNLAAWGFPTELRDSGSLVTLYMSQVNLEGTIPDVFGSFPNLQNLRLSYNNFTGGLPPSLAGSEVVNLWVNNQGLSGTINVVAGMAQLAQVWLHGNAFTGPIPDLSNCTDVFDLQLRDNQLTGPVPESVMTLPKLVNVSLQNNELQGPWPVFGKNVKVEIGTTNSFCLSAPGPCDPQVTALLGVAGGFGYPALLASAWTGNDACASWSVVSCENGKVVNVNLGKQRLSGKISPSFGQLTSLRNLFLNDNNLTGTIPANLTSLANLTTLNVANNNLTGPVPTFGSSVKVITFGNSYIGTNSSSAGSGGSGGSSSTPGSGGSSGGKKSPISAGMIAGLVVAVVFVSALLFVSYKYYINRRHRKFGRVQSPEHGTAIMKVNVMGGGTGGAHGFAGVPSELQSQSSGDHNDISVFEGGNVAISIQVLRQVTNDFSEENILGRGGFAIVYKGELHDGTKIAVKRMEYAAMGTKGMKEFQSEIAVLTKVRHRHLVALLGYCVNGNERLLVFEYMPQGTLGQHLFEWREHGYRPLTWKQRVTIALDVAKGVEYLHSLAQSSFIHRDLKPSNILLGDDMRAKVADFGLVKNAPDGKQSMETRLAGTFGYLAPEYAATGRVTTKVDVYAFGVILMELISGRKALDETMPDEKSHLVTWFRRVLISKDNFQKAIDDVLNPDEETYDSITRVAELAGYCTAREPHQRPDMGHAVNVLAPLVQQWKPTSHEDDENSGIDLHMSLPQALQKWQANEAGTSTMFGDQSYSRTQGSIPSKPPGLKDSFNSSDGR